MVVLNVGVATACYHSYKRLNDSPSLSEKSMRPELIGVCGGAFLLSSGAFVGVIRGSFTFVIWSSLLPIAARVVRGICRTVPEAVECTRAWSRCVSSALRR